MFKKPIKVKSNVTLKNTERRKLLGRIEEYYKLREEDDLELFPAHSPVTWVKAVTHSGDVVHLYFAQNVLLYFEVEGIFYPTLPLLWKCPYLIPYIVVHVPVQDRLLKGADLMIPGIVSDFNPIKNMDYPEGQVIYVTTNRSLAAFAVGVTLVRSSEMFIPNRKGKAVRILHFFEDELFQMSLQDSQMKKSLPILPYSDTDNDDSLCDEAACLDQASVEDEQSPESQCSNEDEQLTTEKSNTESQTMTQDDILLYAFTKALKNLAKNIELPMLTNIFYKNFVIEAVPKNMSLELKKTSYKKLSVFLSEMDKKGVISVETVKGVQSIISVNYQHEMFKRFKDHFKVENENVSKKEETAIKIVEMKVINGAVEKLFRKFGCSKGDNIREQEVHKLVTKYIIDENLIDPQSNKLITLNGDLCDVLQTKDSVMSWKDLFESLFKRMGDSYEITLPGGQPVTRKGKPMPIEMVLANKASNKKVTLVNNLELYGINLQEFSKECQHGVAASVTINNLPNKTSQIQVQGNQKKFIGNLLQEKYFIPKKYIQGLEEQKSKKH